MKPKVNIRNFTASDEDGWFRLLTEAYGSLESRSIDDVRNLVRSKDFSSNWLFLAEAVKEIVGSIRINPLHRKDYYELWDLAISKKYWQGQISRLLIEKALTYLRRKKAQLIRGYTLSIEPYVSAYIDKGLKPTRRILRIDWNLEEELPSLQVRKDVLIENASQYNPEKISDIFVRTLTPFWDWMIGDYGGPEELARVMKARFFAVSNNLKWFLAKRNKEPVGLTGYTSRNGNGRFFGVYVLPEHRMERIGSTLMRVVLDEARRSGLKSLRVYTVASLDRLALAAILYLKSGGRISAEYLQLE